jgi:glucose dehydrogenase
MRIECGERRSKDRKEKMMMRLISVLSIGASLIAATAARSQDIDWQKVDDAIGRKPAVVSGDVHRYGFPRSDLSVTLDWREH